MKRRKNKRMNEKNLDENKKASEPQAAASIKGSTSRDLAGQINKAVEGLYYISETDAEIKPFVGTIAEKVDKEEIIKQTDAPIDAAVEEKDFAAFFARLTEIQDWYGDEEKETVQKFVRLKEVLENNIRDLKVFRIGKIELDVYVVGLDAENTFLGIKTKAVET